MSVNAAIEQLLADTDNWEEPAQEIIDNCNHISRDLPLVFWRSSHIKSDGDVITGQASGQGNVTIRDKPKDEYKEFVFGRSYERVGYFKVWKERNGNLGIRHWWKSDFETKSPDDHGPPEYCLGFDEKTLRPKYFCVVRELLIFRFLGLNFSREYLEPIYGTPEKKYRLWVLRSS